MLFRCAHPIGRSRICKFMYCEKFEYGVDTLNGKRGLVFKLEAQNYWDRHLVLDNSGQMARVSIETAG